MPGSRKYAKKKGLTVIGHRGARGHAPENTLLGIDTGIQLGADWVEFDVQHNNDQLLLMHDLWVNRTTDGKGLLSALTIEELRRLDAGQGQQIPTLEEALELIDQRVGVNIELKTWNGCAASTARVLRDYLDRGWDPENFLVSSFHLPELWEFKQLLPEVPVGALYSGIPLDWAGTAAELGASSINLTKEFVDERLVGDAHARGLKVYVYTANRAHEVEWLSGLGIDGIFTDYPDRVLEWTGRGR